MRGDAEWVADMLEAAEKLEEQGAKGRDRFDQDEIVQLALVHLVQIIGEAASRVSDDLRQRHPEIPCSAGATVVQSADSSRTCPCAGRSTPSASASSSGTSDGRLRISSTSVSCVIEGMATTVTTTPDSSAPAPGGLAFSSRSTPPPRSTSDPDFVLALGDPDTKAPS